ncbi:unnamed protein product [Brassicogethes aeneus]|uniref:Uncharacterized protein n=1 Tax=Brassicogethes aeneus TaxID=1431903 RepID=A0A9P0BEL1_BRAAE|nr:unnamed protein product [Brassicogethes aeneus]
MGPAKAEAPASTSSTKKTVIDSLDRLLEKNPVLKNCIVNSFSRREESMDRKRLNPCFEIINVTDKPSNVYHGCLTPIQIQLYCNIRSKYQVGEDGVFIRSQNKRKKHRKTPPELFDINAKYVSNSTKQEFVIKDKLYEHANKTGMIKDWQKYRKQKRRCVNLLNTSEKMYEDGDLKRMIPQMSENYTGRYCDPYWDFREDFYDVASSSDDTLSISSTESD